MDRKEPHEGEILVSLETGQLYKVNTVSYRNESVSEFRDFTGETITTITEPAVHTIEIVPAKVD